MRAPSHNPFFRVARNALLVTALSTPAAAITVDGSRVGDNYGPPVAIQTVQTGFGDNLNELNALYAQVEGDQLYLLFTGNLEPVFNSINVWFDTTPGGMNRILRPGSALDDLTFDEGFTPDFLTNALAFPNDDFRFQHMALVSDLTAQADRFNDVFDGQPEGINDALEGDFFPVTFGVGFENSNTAGVAAGQEPADREAAAAVTTGVEMRIPLAALGSPAPGDTIRLLAGINGAGFNFYSNQFLPGLAPPQENLGSDGDGARFATLGRLDFNDIPGQQFLELTLTPKLIGDYDGSGAVEQGDLNLVLSNWGSDDLAGLDGWVSQRPLIGRVDQEELNTVLSQWGATLASPTETAVPEPAAGGVLVLMGYAFARRR
ncbi:MAG: hypothetical protein AAGF84_02700 [Planctomycetota bacterium]